MDSGGILVILICIILSAYFSGIEIAFLSANKLKIELENKQGVFSARILSFFIRKPSHFIGAMVLGNNIALVIYGIYMATLLEPPIHRYIWSNTWFVLVLQTLISTFIILMTAEFLPKALFRINPNGVLKYLGIPSMLIYILLWLPMIIMIGFAEGLIRLLIGKNAGDGTDVGLGRIDLDNYLEEVTLDAATNKSEIDQEIQIFRNALDFSKVKARDCMIPRMEIIGIEVNESIENLRKLFAETQLSKILVFRENIDNVIGYAHSYELFRQPQDIRSILLPISIIPETMQAQVLLEDFTRQSRSIAVVVDEFGGTSGLVTMEDIIEEIFGEIDDEHDTEELIEIDLGKGEYLFSGRTDIDYLNEKYHFNLPEDEAYSTLAGFIIHHTESIPEKGFSITLGDFCYVIDNVSGTRIEAIHLKPKAED